MKIAPSTYYDARSRVASPRQLSDERWKEVIQTEWDKRKTLGARKLWLRLRRQGDDIARCTVERLMRELGIAGVLRGRKVRAAIADGSHDRPRDLVDRRFVAAAPDRLWCAAFTYVSTWSGMVYVAFVFDVYSRRIFGWRAARA